MSPGQRIRPMNETLTTLVIAADKFTRQTPYHRAASGPGAALPNSLLLQIGNILPYPLAIFVHFVYSIGRGTHPSQNGTAV